MSYPTPTPELSSVEPSPVISPPIESPPTPSPPEPIAQNLNLPSPDLTPEISVSPSPETAPIEVETPYPDNSIAVEKDIPSYGPAMSLDKSSFFGNIKHTIKKYKVINLAIGIVIASFVSEGVYFFVDDIIMNNAYPLISELLGKRDQINIGGFKLDFKKILRTVIRTIVFTLVLFIVIKISEHLDLL